jgi:hypothetical protein
MATNRTFKGAIKPMGASGHFNEPMRHAMQAKGLKTGHPAEDKPEYGKIYALTGGHGQRSIASGNTWAESEVKKEELSPAQKDVEQRRQRQEGMYGEEEKENLSLPYLDQYSGTESYHKINPFSQVQKGTDGILYLEKNGYGWFVSDMAIAIGSIPKLKNQEFLSIKLKVNPDKTALATVDDGNGKVLYKQEYKYTDARRDLHLYYTNNVMMLSGEY